MNTWNRPACTESKAGKNWHCCYCGRKDDDAVDDVEDRLVRVLFDPLQDPRINLLEVRLWRLGSFVRHGCEAQFIWMAMKMASLGCCKEMPDTKVVNFEVSTILECEI